MAVLLQILIGLVAGGGLILFARRRGERAEVQIYAIGLVIAALIYLGFALVNGGVDRAGLEAAGVGLFGLVAVLGVRYSPLWLGLGWAGHALWDYPLHAGSEWAYVPGWYPMVCLGFDLLLAAYILVRQRS